jgi:hypothetical protein
MCTYVHCVLTRKGQSIPGMWVSVTVSVPVRLLNVVTDYPGCLCVLSASDFSLFQTT